MLKNNKDISKQDGFVAIIVAALIMVILTLITIGFTRIMQREQRQTLDRQLSRQAVYAAESGINDIYSSIKANPNLPAEKITCDVNGLVGTELNPAVNGGKIDSNGVVAYTCALYDKTPTELVYKVSTNQSKVAELKTTSGAKFGSINIRWSNEEGDNNVATLPDCSVAGVFPASRPSNVPLLRVDLTDTSTLSRDSLIEKTDYLYLAPCKNGSVSVSHTFSVGANKGQVVAVGCDGAKTTPCELKIDIPSAISSATYAVRLRSVYASANLVISALDSSGTAVQFKQAQTSIDVTARASDVTRRLRVAIPFATIEDAPEAVFQAFDGVCKLMSVDTSVATPSISDPCNQ